MRKELKDLVDITKSYNEEELETIVKAYKFAELHHSGQTRASGEDYIIHPLSVAYILAEMRADKDTVCAGLLHDILEDTNVTKEEIENEFNGTIANLVEGVTKISKLNFSSKSEEISANTRKIILGITTDVRIIIIKLADRLHNMRTLQFKKPNKQKENALETLELFVPLAYYIGLYRIKHELEDLSLKYLNPDKYKMLAETKLELETSNVDYLQEMKYKIENILNNQNIPNEIKIRTKNIYGIYSRMKQGHTIDTIHDLFSLKVMVDEIYNCFQTLGVIHSLYKPVNNFFKDYIYNPKTNMYQSLHTTVFSKTGRLVQTQIRTFDMDKVASFGLTTYWEKEKGNARHVMQEELKNKYQFFTSLRQIDKIFADNEEFINQVKTEILSDKIYVYTTKGDVIELPIGATPIDFAYKVDTNLGNKIGGVLVNGQAVPIDYNLKNKDRVIILPTKETTAQENWNVLVKTSNARTLIEKHIKRKV